MVIVCDIPYYFLRQLLYCESLIQYHCNPALDTFPYAA